MVSLVPLVHLYVSKGLHVSFWVWADGGKDGEEGRRLGDISYKRETAWKEPAFLSLPFSCVLQGPQGFQGPPGEPGEPGASVS